MAIFAVFCLRIYYSAVVYFYVNPKNFSGCSGEGRVKVLENPATILISLVGCFFIVL
jgi:hypothetical protein